MENDKSASEYVFVSGWIMATFHNERWSKRATEMREGEEQLGLKDFLKPKQRFKDISQQ